MTLRRFLELGSGLAALLLLPALASCGGDGDEPGGATEEPVTVRTLTEHPALFPPNSLAEPRFSPDGLWLAFSVRTDEGMRVGIMRPDGSGARCVTCQAGANAGKPAWFPDGRRLLLRGIGTDFFVVDVQTQQVSRIEGVNTDPVEHNRVPVLSPDGRKLVWTKVRIDGFRMLMADLIHDAGGYRVENIRLLYPLPVTDSEDAEQWRHLGAWYEAKEFTDGGRTLIFSGTRDQGGNVDVYLLDLETGAITRVTTHPEWDEGAEASPDGRWFVFETTRAYDVLSVFANVPVPSYLDLSMVSPITRITLSGPLHALHEVYFIDRRGDRPGYIGQRLSRSEDGFAVRAAAHWSPDGTQVVWGELSYDTGHRRIRLLDFTARPPVMPLPVRDTPTPTWAPRLRDVRAAPLRVHRLLRGKHSGTVELSLQGVLIQGRFVATYMDYSDDGEHVLNGTMAVEVTSIDQSHLDANIQLSGQHRGFVAFDLSVNGTRPSGSLVSVRDGVRYEKRFD